MKVKYWFSYLEKEIESGFSDKHIEILFNNINDNRLYNILFNWVSRDTIRLKALIIHSTKGLKFRNVTIFFNDFIDFNNKIIKWEEFYVACTRAKDQLVIIVKDKSIFLEYLNSRDKNFKKYILRIKIINDNNEWQNL